MPKLTPQEAQQKHATRLKASISDIRAGIDRVTTAPGQKAAAKRDKWVARITDPETQAKWARNVAAVPLEKWKAKARDIGAGRIPAGIDAAADEMTKFYSQLFPFQESLQSRVKSMPDVTLSDSVARAIAWIEGRAKFSYQK